MNISSNFSGTVQLERHSIKPCSVERLLPYGHCNMAAVAPTYPLYPIACFLSAIMLFLVFFTSFLRQSWNLGVAFLCFWLFLENLSYGANAIIWSDNMDLKYYAYCDVGEYIFRPGPGSSQAYSTSSLHVSHTFTSHCRRCQAYGKPDHNAPTLHARQPPINGAS